MTTPKMARRSLGACGLAALASSLLSCGDNHACHTFASTDWWVNAGYDLSVSTPSACPATIPNTTSLVSFAGAFTGPLWDVTGPGPATTILVEAFNHDGVAESQQLQFEFYDPGNGSGYGEADADIQYYAATAIISDDEVLGETDDTQSGNEAGGGAIITYNITVNALITGPSTVTTGHSTTWTGSKTGTSDPQTYQWRRNDTLLVGQTGSTYSFSPVNPGVFRLTLNTTDTKTGKQDSTQDSVRATFSSSIRGPTSVHLPSGTCEWDAIVNGGVAPLTYTWTWDGAVVGNAASYFGVANSTSHNLALNVKDSKGWQASAAISVLGTTSGGTACKQ